MNDLVSRQATIDAVHSTIFDFFDIDEYDADSPMTESDKRLLKLNKAITTAIRRLPSVDLLDQTVYGYSIRFLVYVAAVMAKKGITAEQAAEMVTDMRAFVSLFYEEQKEITRKALEEIGKSQKSYTDWELRGE